MKSACSVGRFSAGGKGVAGCRWGSFAAMSKFSSFRGA